MEIQYYDWSAHHANRRPNEIAIVDVFGGRNLSYGSLDDRACRLASWLHTHGVGRGDRVAILAPNCPEVFELEFASGKIGCIALPLNWRLTVPELEYILNDSSPSVLIYDERFRPAAEELAKRCNLPQLLQLDVEDARNEYAEAIAGASDTPETLRLKLSDPAMILYTSGTTGHPKGAIITHQMNLINAFNLGTPAAISPATVQLVILPLFHTGGLNCYANPILHAGGRLLLMREFEPGRTLQILGDPALGVTHIFAVPAPYQFMMQHPDFDSTDLSRLSNAGIGGAPCAEPILKGWLDRGVPMVQGWGMTETSPGGLSLDTVDAVRKVGSTGKPLMHTEVKIVDDEGNTLGPGGIGELLIRGPNITPGYWNNPEATADSFDGDWLKTGDAARIDEEGYFYIVDRWKDMYISGGENVYPAEVENVLYGLPQIAEVAVIGVPSERWGETGMAIIVTKPDQSIDEQTIIDHCLANLAKFKVPQSVAFIDILPRNATGKVLKRELRTRYIDADAPAIS